MEWKLKLNTTKSNDLLRVGTHIPLHINAEFHLDYKDITLRYLKYLSNLLTRNEEMECNTHSMSKFLRFGFLNNFRVFFFYFLLERIRPVFCLHFSDNNIDFYRKISDEICSK